MIRDLFALLAEARARISSNTLAIDARRDFWLATVDLHAAIVGLRDAGEAADMPRTMPTGDAARAGDH